jgi:hypothetical protein
MRVEKFLRKYLNMKSNKKPAKKKVNLKKNLEVAAELRSFLKNSEIARSICEENNYDPQILDGISILFRDDLDVKAKTKNGEILLNQKLLNEDISKLKTYLIHELTHVFQHIERIGKKDPYKDKDYLDRPDEIEAFQNQIEQDFQGRPMAKVKKYIEKLVGYHKVPEKDRNEKIEELMGNID